MATLKEKVGVALNEARTLILGAEIVFGFQLHAAFQPGFERLAPYQRWLDVAALALMSVAVALLIAPSPYHRLGEKGRDTPSILRFTTIMAAWALLPIGLSIGIDIFIVAERLIGTLPSLALGLAIGLVALFLWYVIEVLQRQARGGPSMNEPPPGKEEMATSLSEKIKTLMIEARVILPGAQALLGFQFIAFFSNGFEQMPSPAKLVHVVSLCCVAVATILLMAPAAYHRLVTSGEDRPDVDRFGSRAMLAALIPLAVGLSSEFYVVLSKLGSPRAPAVAVTLGMLALFLGLWFGLPIAALIRHDRQAKRPKRRRA